MTDIDKILERLESCNFKISTDTRKDIKGTIYFALKGETFDGNRYAKEALIKGASGAISDDKKNTGKNVYIVKNVTKTLQDVAIKYREKFNIPIIAIGGSNGKTTSKELIRDVLKNKYKVHSTEGNFNNHIGVPLSLLSMIKATEIGVFEIGANRPKEHLDLLNILKPTHAVVTNNGMDHLEGFRSPSGVRKANKEIYDWAYANNAKVFVNKNHNDLIIDSRKNERIIYPEKKLKLDDKNNKTLNIKFNNKNYKTKIAGKYNVENIELALSIGNKFNINTIQALNTICKYTPTLKRSQLMRKNNINFIVDCYNANPTSMKLSIDSFLQSTKNKRGVILGDMLELGKYSNNEHKKIFKYVTSQKIDYIIFIGSNFKKNIRNEKLNYKWFPDSDMARIWFDNQKFKNFTFLLKGSRGMKIEKIIE